MEECVECNAKERVIFAERGRAQELSGWLNEANERRNELEDRLHAYLGLLKTQKEAEESVTDPKAIGGYESASSRARRLSQASLAKVRAEQANVNAT